MEYFKGDETEKKINACGDSLFQVLNGEMRLFLQNAYKSAELGRVIYKEAVAPLVNVLPKEKFAASINALLENFQRAGTFESYISVFKTIFGADTDVTFEILDKAQLRIHIAAKRADTLMWNTQTGQKMQTKDGRLITFQRTVKSGDYYQARQVLNILTPAGVYLEINFTNK